MTIESSEDLEGLREAGRVVRLALEEMKGAVEPGMTTAELDRIGGKVLEQHGAVSAPRKVYGFPGINCISLSDEAVHGVPRERRIEASDLVKIDVIAGLNGYIADAALTVVMPEAPAPGESLTRCAERAFYRAADVARAGRPLNKIGRVVVENVVRRSGFAVLTECSSHGVGRTIHEEPTVPNYFDPRLTTPLTRGLVITIEPIISAGSSRCIERDDGWTLATSDGSLSAHYEHTVVVTKGKPILLTAA